MTVFRWNSLQDLFAIQEKVNRLFEETIHRTEFPEEGLDSALWSPANEPGRGRPSRSLCSIPPC